MSRLILLAIPPLQHFPVAHAGNLNPHVPIGRRSICCNAPRGEIHFISPRREIRHGALNKVEPCDPSWWISRRKSPLGNPKYQQGNVNLIRKKIAAPVARETVTNNLEWDVIGNDRFLFIEGLRWKEKWNLSFWDALILAAARKARAKEVWSEDLVSGHDYDGLVIVNPLIAQ